MDWFSYLVAGIMVYVAVGFFVLGMGYRVYQWVRAPKTRVKTGIFPKPNTLGDRWLTVARDSFIFPQAIASDRWMWIFTILFHFGLLGAFVGHLRLIQEFTPLASVLGAKGLNQLSLWGGGVMGIILLVALAYYLLRRFTSPYKEMSILEDYLLLVLLILIVVMGNHMRFAGNVHTADYRAYVQSLTALKPAFPEALADSSIRSALVFHVLFANLLLIYFPFSKLVHVIATFPANLAKRK
jgi:nitrate reductase gamma subunit